MRVESSILIEEGSEVLRKCKTLADISGEYNVYIVYNGAYKSDRDREIDIDSKIVVIGNHRDVSRLEGDAVNIGVSEGYMGNAYK